MKCAACKHYGDDFIIMRVMVIKKAQSDEFDGFAILREAGEDYSDEGNIYICPHCGTVKVNLKEIEGD